MDARVTGPRDRVDIAMRRAEIAARRKAARRRIDPRWGLALLVAIGVPALAATTDMDMRWGAVTEIPAGGSGPVVARMPFEREGWNFPGSAYYYLEADSVAAPDAGGEGATSAPSAIAAAFRRAGSATDQRRALTCLTQAIYYEAASESDSGQRAVAQVVLNRVKHASWPGTVCGVVFQGSTRKTGCQFSFTCDGSLARRPSRSAWDKAQDIARAALSGYVHAPAGLATHYHTLAVNPYWAPRLATLTVIGAHRFYVLPGSAGRLRAFATNYRGDEPTISAVRANDSRMPDPLDDLPQVAPASTAPPQTDDRLPPAPRALDRRPGDPAPAPSASPAPRDDRLPGGGTVRPEYRDSGRWRTPAAKPSED
ncbi:cell wall hydrolase [Blastomonas marina]|uniref:cell wall hydrolase n=1 Tax=Blastomonas marina TaxID=1867408 RepID=UPI002688B860|nr:cell wall hydrolase [Blastomonas marina]WPZ04439.1 cell wall hydrolase [Blastomonas marina]